MEKREWLAWAVTALVAAGAAWAAWALYEREMSDPWTRDGQVGADLVLISSPSSGELEKVAVRSDSAVERGELLFSLNTEPFLAAREEAAAGLRLAQAREHALALRVREQGGGPGRDEKAWRRLLADHRAAGAAVEKGRKELEAAGRALEGVEVRAPAGGFVMQCGLQEGGTVKAGEPLFALAVKDSFRVTGFFRETVIRHIRAGDRARVTLMAYPDRPLSGVVESVGRGIARHDGALNGELLPEVTPTFDWIRLAQRVPVRVRLDAVPPDVELRVGLTASVQVLKQP